MKPLFAPFTVKQICVIGVMACLVLLGTMILRLPVSAYGYIHLGDALIYVFAVYWGKRYGALAGAFGACLADILSGYAFMAPSTFVIKFAMGFAVGRLADKRRNVFKNIFAVAIGALIMLAGYFITMLIITGNLYTAFFGETVWDFAQAVGGVAMYLALGTVIFRLRLYNHI